MACVMQCALPDLKAYESYPDKDAEPLTRNEHGGFPTTTVSRRRLDASSGAWLVLCWNSLREELGDPQQDLSE